MDFIFLCDLPQLSLVASIVTFLFHDTENSVLLAHKTQS